MIRAPKDNAIRICLPYQMFEETGLLVIRVLKVQVFVN